MYSKLERSSSSCVLANFKMGCYKRDPREFFGMVQGNMLIRCNTKLNYDDIERRISSNLRAMERAVEFDHGNTTEICANKTENVAIKGNSMLRYRTKRRSLLNKCGVWFKSFMKLYKTRDQAILSLKIAAESEDRISIIESRLHTLKASISDLQSLGSRVEEQLKLTELRSNEAFGRSHEAFERIDKYTLTVDEAINREIKRLECVNKSQFGDFYGELSRLSGVVTRLKDEIMFQQRRLTQILLSERDCVPGSKSLDNVNIVADDRLESFYAAFEDAFRGERNDIKSRLFKYVDILKLAGAGQLKKPVLDLGCGRGEWLELLKDHHIPAYGVDSNAVMVERTQTLGLDARQADALQHLRELPDNCVSAMTAFHVVEHIPFDALISWLDEAMRVIVPGGLILLETPNPETIRVGATTFYNDPTHRNPIPPSVLKFLVEHRGFEAAEILRLHPFADGLLQEPTADAELLNRVLFGPQDYAVIARRL